MGDRGRVLHVRAAGAGRLAAALGPHEVLGKNRRWTSFVPTGGAEPEPAELARACAAPVVRVWFDEDVGVSVDVAGADGFVGQLGLPLGEAGLGGEDQRTLDGCVRRRILTTEAARELAARASTARGRDAWIRRHAVEALFGFPFTGSAPITMAPVAAPVAAPSSPSSASPADAPAARSWAAAERAIVELHVHYWAQVWSMNVWGLYNRYKKHLPAAARSDVDRLCDAVARGAEDEVRTRVESVLARVWGAEDWGAIIRDAKLDDDGADARTLAEWRRMTGRA